jgi:hypothetical protein
MKVKFKLNQSLRGLSKGHILSLEVDKSGMPVDRYWRRRMVEAEHDKCMSQLIDNPTLEISEAEFDQEFKKNKKKAKN